MAFWIAATCSQASGPFAELLMSAGSGASPGRAGRCSMTAAEYRVMAEECCEWARKTYPDKAREIYGSLDSGIASRIDGPGGSKQKPDFKAGLARGRLQT